MFYNRIKRNAEGRRIVGRLLALQNQLMAEGPPPKKRNTMLMATWNIREFDSPAYGDRQEEAYYYIAEIMSHFDLIAVQEVRENLEALYEVIKILGDGWWDFIVTDVTEGKPGNRERMAFVYDKRKVKFGGVAGEVVIPPKASRAGGQKTVYTPSDQLVRTPFLCGFRAGWAKFMLCTVHVLYGKSTKDDPRRVKEIELIAQFLAKRAGEDSTWSENIILLGDFNIFSPQDVTMKAILDAGFVIPEALREVPASNVGKRKRNYDQIAVLPKRFRLGTQACSTSTSRSSVMRMRRHMSRPWAGRISRARRATCATRAVSGSTTAPTGARIRCPTICRCGSSFRQTSAASTCRPGSSRLGLDGLCTNDSVGSRQDACRPGRDGRSAGTTPARMAVPAMG